MRRGRSDSAGGLEAGLPRVMGAAVLALVLAGCARPVSVGTDPGAGYAVEVVNRTGIALDVAFDDGTGPRSLGRVAAGRTERFVVVTREGPSVTIVGTGGGSTWRSPATLRAGATVSVVLGP